MVLCNGVFRPTTDTVLCNDDVMLVAKIGHGRRIYSMDFDKCYKLDFMS